MAKNVLVKSCNKPFRYLLPGKDFLEFKRKLIKEINRVNREVERISETVCSDTKHLKLGEPWIFNPRESRLSVNWQKIEPRILGDEVR